MENNGVSGDDRTITNEDDHLTPIQRCLLDRLSISGKSDWARLLSAVNANVNRGVVASIHQTRQRYWRHWQEFLPLGFNPYLQDLAPAERIFARQGFC